MKTFRQEQKSRRFVHPEQLLHSLAIEHPCEIDLEAIAWECGAKVEYQPLKSCEARIIANASRAIITVNATSMWERQRFSIGHELGHLMHGHGRIGFSCNTRNINQVWDPHEPEYQANRYSANLLMPRFMFQPITKGTPITFDSVNELKEIFQTSSTATAFRLNEIGSLPSMIIMSTSERKINFRRDPDIPHVWPHKRLETDTLAFKLHQSNDFRLGPEEISAECWIDHPTSRLKYIIEDSIKISKNTVLSLLWWKDETQLLELMDTFEE